MGNIVTQKIKYDLYQIHEMNKWLENHLRHKIYYFVGKQAIVKVEIEHNSRLDIHQRIYNEICSANNHELLAPHPINTLHWQSSHQNPSHLLLSSSADNFDRLMPSLHHSVSPHCYTSNILVSINYF